jgi:dTDP-4-dehydrorhamnose 3,5-epimerase
VKILASEIPAVKVIEPQIWPDYRGFFMETWNHRAFLDAGISADFVQDNHSHSVKGTLRGLHYQIVRPQGKLVRVTNGEIYDVAVDLRRSSPTFARWTGYHVSAENRRMLWVPPGFAHGYYVLSEVADCLYKCSEYYAPELERVLAWDDPDVGAEWPLNEGKMPLLSTRDSRGIRLSEAELFA